MTQFTLVGGPTVQAKGDSGVLELNFRDERYIPFEGAGAISKWRLELPDTFREFGYDSITDVVMHFVTRLLMEETKWLF